MRARRGRVVVGTRHSEATSKVPVNALTSHVGTSPNLSDFPTYQDLAGTKGELWCLRQKKRTFHSYSVNCDASRN